MSDCHDCGAGPAVSVASPPGSKSGFGVVALVGPPNSGKSTLFNRLTGLRQKVANFPGVTVEQHTGVLRLENGREVSLIDLPGIYSLKARSEDEKITHDVLHGLRPESPRPDAVLLILDSTNLGRHLLLAAPILSLGLPTLVVLNMADDLRSRSGDVDTEALSHQLGAPVALVSASRGEGLATVLQFLAGAAEAKKPVVELPVLNDIPHCRRWAAHVGDSARYQAPAPAVWTRRLDGLFLHPVGGPLIFAAVVVAVFQSIFTLAQPMMNWVHDVVAASGVAVGALLPEGWIRSLAVEGIWGGVGSVVVFLPADPDPVSLHRRA